MTEINARLALRLAALAIATVVAQTSVISRFELLGVSADATPLVACAVGLTCGALAGACFGFGMGLFADSALGMTIGVASLVYLTIGYLSGRVRDIRDPRGRLVAPAAGAIATVASLAGFGLVGFVLGDNGPVSPQVGWQLLVSVAINALVAPGVLAATRRWVTPTFPDELRDRRRRRAYTTGGLSPRGSDASA